MGLPALWLFIFFSTQPKLMKKIPEPQFISEETEAQKGRPCSKSQDQGRSHQVSGLQAQCASCDALATFCPQPVDEKSREIQSDQWTRPGELAV